MSTALFAPPYQSAAAQEDADRCVNLIPERVGGRLIFRYRPGLEVQGTGYGAIRAMHWSIGDLYFIEGSNARKGTGGTLLGSAGAGGTAAITDNGTSVLFCGGGINSFKIWSGGVFSTPAGSFVAQASACFLDGYLIVPYLLTRPGKFGISKVYDAATWAALDVASAESSPDVLFAVATFGKLLWLFGTDTSETWYNSGSARFPFERVQGAPLRIGIVGDGAVATTAAFVYWIGKTPDGNVAVYRASNPGQAEKISTPLVERGLLRAPSRLLYATVTTCEILGHKFVLFTPDDRTSGGLPEPRPRSSFVYDETTSLWSEWSLYIDGVFYAFPSHHAYAATLDSTSQSHYFGGVGGTIYKINEGLFKQTDVGLPIERARAAPHVADLKHQRWNQYRALVETGVQAGAGTDIPSGSNYRTVTLRASISDTATTVTVYGIDSTQTMLVDQFLIGSERMMVLSTAYINDPGDVYASFTVARHARATSAAAYTAGTVMYAAWLGTQYAPIKAQLNPGDLTTTVRALVAPYATNGTFYATVQTTVGGPREDILITSADAPVLQGDGSYETTLHLARGQLGTTAQTWVIASYLGIPSALRLNTTIGAGDTSMVLTAGIGFGTLMFTSPTRVAKIDSEYVQMTSVGYSAPTFTVSIMIRGVNSSTAAAHTAGALLYLPEVNTQQVAFGDMDLRWSDDGGVTWTDRKVVPFDASNQTHARWLRLGRGQGPRVYEWHTNANRSIVLLEADAMAEELTT